MGSGTQNPLLYTLLKMATSVQLKRKGISLSDSQAALSQLDGGIIDGVAADAGVAYPAEKGASGQIIAALLAFLASPQGQALMAALIQMLISLIAGGG
jgi:hypothetical protein